MGGAFALPDTAPGRRATADLAYDRMNGGEVAVGDVLEVNGQPMRLSVFSTSDPPRAVALFYARAFAARGVTPFVNPEEKAAQVAGFDPRDGNQRFVSALSQPDGQTLVLVGLTNPRRPPRFTTGAKEAGFPVPVESRAYLGYRSTDAGAEAESGQFVSPLASAEILAFYRHELPPRGFAERTGDSAGSLAVFGKGRETLSVTVQALGEHAGSAVFVSRTGVVR